jgi:formate/nitrite transporter FocA (FNT family)
MRTLCRLTVTMLLYPPSTLSTTEQYIGLALPVIMFVALGVMHSPANMGYLFTALVHGHGIGTYVSRSVPDIHVVGWELWCVDMTVSFMRILTGRNYWVK